jgi:redox-sensitive bicupin YhaK (pirin superfamily)
MPEREFASTGGRMHGFQLWVILPARDKLMSPRYQEIPAEEIPRAESEDGLVSVRVVAGEALGARARIETRTPIFYLHYTIKPGGSVSQSVPEGFNVFAYVIDGEGRFGADSRAARDGQMVLFDADGEEARISNPADSGEDLDVLLLGGLPLGEPVARYGPFVMNTEAEIYQAFEDFRSGRMGAIDF